MLDAQKRESMTERTYSKLYVFLIYVVLTLAIIIAYEPIHRNDFLNYDDDSYVTKNPQVTAGITRESLIWAFTTPHVSNWHPLTSLSHMLDCQLFGLNSFWHHLVNLSFHIANTLLLFWVLQRMTGSVWASAFVAAAFALHPLRVESVAWVAERKGVLSGFFWMLTMAAYIRYTQRPSIARYMLVFLFFALGLMAKPMVITLPFVLLLLDYWPLDRFQLKLQTRKKTSRKIKSAGLKCPSSSVWRLVVEKIPLFVLVIISVVLTLVFQRIGGAITSTEALPMNLRFGNAAVSYIRYIGKMAWPTHLAVFYPHPRVDLPPWQPILAFMILAGISAVIIHIGRHKRYLTVGWLWYLGTLVPVIGLIQVGSQAMADRYTYLPSIGIFILVTWGAVELTAQRQHRRFILAISTAVILVVLGICTHLQLRHWRNNSTLFGHALKVTRDNHVMYNNYGNVLMEKGQCEKAIEHFTEALRINPQYLTARGNLVRAFNELGYLYYRQGKVELAVSHWTQTARLKPDFVEVLTNLAWILATTKNDNIYNPDEAVKYAKRACELTNHKQLKSLDALAAAYAAAGNFPEAVKTAERAIKLAEAADEKDLAKKIQERLGLYKSDQRYREK